MSQKTCFVIMPIRKPGTAEYAHFRAIFEQLKPSIEKEGFIVLRADDVQKSGAITRDIIANLAEADLVVADLTDLNPNVFYELGVRHALRGNGTVMILDEKRTVDIPFDLGAYRVIKFIGDLTGIEPLRTSLEAFIRESHGADGARRDNPVHDWYPMLPLNALESASQSSTGPLRKTIKELEDRIEQYERTFGAKLPHKSRDNSPLSLVMSAISDAEDGLLPVNVLEDARKAFEARDVVALLQKIRTVIERNIRLPSTAFLALAKYAAVLDLDVVSRAVYEQARQLYPSDRNLKRSYLFYLAQSESPADRERARTEIANELELAITNDEVVFRDPDRIRNSLSSVGMLLDAYHGDGLAHQALRITERMVELFPQSTAALRNHARSLEGVGSMKKAMEFYRAAVLAPDVDDTSAVWLGNTLHNYRNFAAAVEAYALGCLLDPTEASAFAHVADEISICLAATSFARLLQNTTLPASIEATDVIVMATCSASCPNFDAEASQRLRTALERLELTPEGLDVGLSRTARIEHAKRIYEAVRSGLTTPGREFDFAPHPKPEELSDSDRIDVKTDLSGSN
jgi:tetratricopeptide (TPR) repeat protein